MIKKQFHIKAHQYLLLLIAFCLPFARLVAIFIALLLLNWLLEGDFKNKLHTIFKNKFALLFLAFYVLHLVGLLYTQNMEAGLFDIQVKLSLLIFPLILGSRPVDKTDRDTIFLALIAGGIFSALMMLTRAIFTYFTTGEENFYYEAFSSFLIHPSYISMYLNVVISWMLINLMNGGFAGKKFSNKIAVAIILFFSFIIVLLSSKMGLITLLLIYISFLVYFIIKRKKYLLGFSGIVLIFLAIFLVLQLSPEIKGRVTRAISAVTNDNPDQKNAESTAVRMLVWKAANQVISEHPLLGAGTGDAKDELMKEYENRGMTGAIEHKLNSHNEFYQVFVALGLIGLILLLAGLFLPMIFAIRKPDPIYFCFLLIIIFNFLPESMLETQAGVMFYAFFNSMLCFCNFKVTKEPAVTGTVN
ncbi:MAG: hypothetical protein JWP12_1478 [Bacteroidetes bacterium]|nr:hypothetical protein [Bacteroidota bacterium]